MMENELHNENNFDVIIIGAGAAGLMCAATAGKRGRSVLVLDHAEKAGRKILISGGGKCNFTNRTVSAENFISANPHFSKSALSRYSPYDFIELIEQHQIPYHEREHGQLFCDRSANDIVQMLLKECHDAGVTIRTGYPVQSVLHSREYILSTAQGIYHGESLVIATGGLSIAKIGASDFGYRIARQFGLEIIQPRPGLVPLLFTSRTLNKLGNLSGISVDAVISCNGHSFREALLFTHRGISGPAVLQASNYWNYGDTIQINLLPEIDLAAQINNWREQHPRATLPTRISTLLPRRLVTALLAGQSTEKPVNELSGNDIETVANIFHNWTMHPSGDAGFDKAEVTVGGVATDAISSKSFEAKQVPGLFFIGEVLDVTGWLGGYNFQWAWASGYCAGNYV
jgi:predicted Rossmann fold flavoprotein